MTKLEALRLIIDLATDNALMERDCAGEEYALAEFARQQEAFGIIEEWFSIEEQAEENGWSSHG